MNIQSGHTTQNNFLSQAQRQDTGVLSDHQNIIGKSPGNTIFSPHSHISNQNKPQNNYFQKIKKELKDHLGPDATDADLQNIDLNIDRLLDLHGQINVLLSDYDKKLIQVLTRHEHDFLAAYKTHMTKVEKELQYLKSKARDQEKRLASDERILRLEKQLQWFKDELTRLKKKQDENHNEIDMLGNKVQSMKEEKKFMEDQVKASKRQNKLLIVALNKTQNQKGELHQENLEINNQMLDTKKAAVEMPSLHLSPFDMTAVNMSQAQQEQSQNFQIQQIQHKNGMNISQNKPNKLRPELEKSLLASTEFPSELNTERFKHFESQYNQFQSQTEKVNNLNNDIQQHLSQNYQQQTALQHLNQSFVPQNVVQQYVFDLIKSGRNDPEIVEGLEQYYNKLCKNSDDEIIKLREELEIQKALARELQADEVVMPATDQDDLSNFFLDCVYEQRKSLRHQLVTMKLKNQGNLNITSTNTSKIQNSSLNYGIIGGGVNTSRITHGSTLSNNQAGNRTVSNVFNNSLLNTYINTVKTGTQEEIEQFSQIEKQKLVQLLVTNNELLNYMFDKMFKNKKKGKDQNSQSQQQLHQQNQNLDLLQMQLEDSTDYLTQQQQQQQLQFNQIDESVMAGNGYQTYGQNSNTYTRGTFSPVIQYQNQSKQSNTAKNSQQIFGLQNSSDPYLAFSELLKNQEKQGQNPQMKERKQKSMIQDYQTNNPQQNNKQFNMKTQHYNTANLTNIAQTFSDTTSQQHQNEDNNVNNLNINNTMIQLDGNNNNAHAKQIQQQDVNIHAYNSASPLLVKPQGTKILQSNILLSRIKESAGFNTNLLSQIDTDLHQQQYLSQDNTTILNSQSPKTQYYDSTVNKDQQQNMQNYKRSKFAEAAEKNFFKFPEINSTQRRISHGNLAEIGSGTAASGKIRSTYNNGFDSSYGTEKLLQGSKNLLMMNNTVNNINNNGNKRGKSTRPLMQVKNGKLLLVKAV